VTHVERHGADTSLLVSTTQAETLRVSLFGQGPTEVGTAVRLGWHEAQALRFDAEGRRLR
jgi:hypothetical protein